MAFVGRMNSRCKVVDCEMYSGGRSKLQMQPFTTEDEGEMEIPQSRCSRTYIKTYGMERSELVSIPSTVRFVGGSASSCEVNSMADTEMSTLRCNSPRSLESLTVCQSPTENTSENSSMSESNAYSDPNTDEQPLERMIFVQGEVEKRPLERGSTTSMCSWEPEEAMSVYEESPLTEFESQGRDVPFLELGSGTASLNDDQQEQLGQMKMLRQSNEAYDNWLSGKKRQYQYKQQAAREQKKQLREKEEYRRRLNEQRVQEWCKRKAQQSINSVKRRINNNNKSQSQFDEEAQLRLQAWEMRKIQEAEHRRQIQQCQAYRKQQEQQQRKEQAAIAWNHWIKSAPQRPKPVPLNQGFKTLRGTISDIYINPNQWVH
ncbi:mitogen-activated protein kinase kinase kinase kinase 4 [Drosophila innubila]|uniref:mitogen-activated protein kinase kinase kinase kinase 4 n=1 Tax=Drosophila innubila TaxID=198719 RepID=UPI00148E5C7E|nr:mitogen-activated protein kinase kinase kinase kinase 4 [Drosophila innubila]